MALLQHITAHLHLEFSMTNLGDMCHFLGISMTHNIGNLFLSQRKYIVDLLQHVGMSECHPIVTSVVAPAKLWATDDTPVADPSECMSLAGALQYIPHSNKVRPSLHHLADLPVHARFSRAAPHDDRCLFYRSSHWCWRHRLPNRLLWSDFVWIIWNLNFKVWELQIEFWDKNDFKWKGGQQKIWITRWDLQLLFWSFLHTTLFEQFEIWIIKYENFE